MFYFFIFSILLILSVIDVFVSDKKIKKYLLFFVEFILIVIAGFKYETGGDWPYYYRIFEEIKTLKEGFSPFDYTLEYGFTTLCSIIKTCGGSIQVLYLLLSLFNILFIGITLRQIIPYPILGLLVYFSTVFFGLEFGFTRQSVAVSIIFYSLIHIEKKSFFNYVFLIIISSFFHITSLIFIPFYFILNKKFKVQVLIIIYIIGLLIYLFGVTWFGNFMIYLTRYFFRSYEDMVHFYVQHPVFSLSRIISVGLFLNIIILSLIIFKYEKIQSCKYGTILINSVFISLIIPLYLYEIGTVADRFRYFCMISLSAIFPLLVVYNFRYLKKAIFTFVIVYSFLFSRKYFFEHITTLSFKYQNYIVWQMLDIPSTGEYRHDIAEEAIKKDL
jgi:hypothetical protein